MSSTEGDSRVLESLHTFLQSAGHPRICVVGDMMLDTYVWGEVGRISPEGPIPVLRVERRERRPGGAGSVAVMLTRLGARVLPVGLVGEDVPARQLRQELQEEGLQTDGILSSEHRPTTTKERCLGYVQSAGRALQQIVRVDEELTEPLTRLETAALQDAIGRAVGEADLVVIQDMGKGLLDPDLTAEIIHSAHRQDKPVIVDPERAENYAPYRGADWVLPNRYEAELATGLSLREEEDYRRAAHTLLEELELAGVLVKLDREGIYFATADGEAGHVGAHTREVADVTGAGDMVTAAFAFARAAGGDFRAAAELANFAAGMEVTLHGASPLPRRRLAEALRAQADPAARKLVDRGRIEGLAEELRKEGRRIAFTNGCFDLLHLGHVRLLSHAAEQGDVLVVGLNSDTSARKLKGPGRPVNPEDVRARVLASMAAVDYVVLFDEESVLPLIEQIRPDVLVKGGDYTPEQVVGHEFVRSYGGQVELAPQVPGLSTTELIERIARNNERSD